MRVYYVLQIYVFKPLSPLCLAKAHISINNNTLRLYFQLELSGDITLSGMIL